MANTVYLSPASVMWDTTLTANGALNIAGNVYCNLAGTTTPANTYTANGGATLNPNPLQVNSIGRLNDQIWQLQGVAIDATLVDVNGNLLDFQPNLLGIDDPSFSSTQANNAFNAANAAYTQANTATTTATGAYQQANAARSAANSAANTVAVFANGTIVLANANVNFNNTSTVNVSCTANGTLQTNVAFTVNLTGIGATTSSASANGYAALTANTSLQWGSIAVSSAAAPIAVTFPIAFNSTCYSVIVNLTSNGSGQDYIPRPFNVSRTGFQIYYDAFGGTFTSGTIYWQATGS